MDSRMHLLNTVDRVVEFMLNAKRISGQTQDATLSTDMERLCKSVLKMFRGSATADFNKVAIATQGEFNRLFRLATAANIDIGKFYSLYILPCAQNTGYIEPFSKLYGIWIGKFTPTPPR